MPAEASASRRRTSTARTTTPRATSTAKTREAAARGESIADLSQLTANVDKLRQACQSTFSSTQNINQESAAKAKELKGTLEELKAAMSQQYRTGLSKKLNKAMQKLPGKLGDKFRPETVSKQLDAMCKHAMVVFDAQVEQYHNLADNTDLLYAHITKMAEDHAATTQDVVALYKDVQACKKDLDKAVADMAKYEGVDPARFSEAQLREADYKAELSQLSRKARTGERILEQIKDGKVQFEEFAEIMEKVLADNADMLQLAHGSIQRVMIGSQATGAVMDALNGIEDLKKSIMTADDAVSGVMQLAAASASMDRLTELSNHIEQNAATTRASFQPVLALRDAENELFIAEILQRAAEAEKNGGKILPDMDMFVTKDQAAKGSRARVPKTRLNKAPDLYSAD